MSFLEKAKPTTQASFLTKAKPTAKVQQQQPKENNMLQNFAQNVLVRPVIRATQAVATGVAEGAKLFASPEKKARIDAGIQRANAAPVTTPLLGTTQPQKAFGEGGGKQLLKDAGKTALDITAFGAPGGAKALSTGKSIIRKRGKSNGVVSSLCCYH